MSGIWRCCAGEVEQMDRESSKARLATQNLQDWTSHRTPKERARALRLGVHLERGVEMNCLVEPGPRRW